MITYKDRHYLPDANAVAVLDMPGDYSWFVKQYADDYGVSVKQRISTFSVLNFRLVHKPDKHRFFHNHGTSGIHNLMPEKGKFFCFTVLDHPLDLCRYYYMLHLVNNREETLDAFLYRYNPNRLIFWFGNGDSVVAEERVFEQYAFFGLTDNFTKTTRELSALFPKLNFICEENVLRSRAITATDHAIEYFMEKNAKDIEFYEKAVREFKRRYYNDIHDPAGDGSGMSIKGCDIGLPESMDIVESGNTGIIGDQHGLHRIHAFQNRQSKICEDIKQSRKIQDHDFGIEIFNLYEFAKRTNDQTLMTNIHEYALRYDEPLYNFFALLSCLALGRNEDVDPLGNKLFDSMDDLDESNLVDSVVRLRIMMIDEFLTRWSHVLEGAFSERCRMWLESLCGTRGWNGEAYLRKAYLQRAYGDIDTAIDCAKSAVAARPDNEQYHGILSDFLREAGKIDEVEIRIQDELKRNPKSEWACRQLAYVLEAKGNFFEAEQAFERGVAINPYWAEGWLASSRICRTLGMMDKAIEHARRAVQADREKFDSSAHLCNLLLEQKLYDEAASVARESVALFPWWGYMHGVLSKIHEARGEVDDAILEAKRAVDASPETMEFREYVAAILIRYGKLDSAKEDALRSMGEFPDQAWPLLQLSKVCEAQGDIAQGLEYARKAYALQPEKRSVSANLAHFLRLARNDDEFEDFCQKAIKENPNQGWVWRELCRKADARGDRARALEMGAKALAVHPEDGEFREYYAMLAQHDGDYRTTGI